MEPRRNKKGHLFRPTRCALHLFIFERWPWKDPDITYKEHRAQLTKDFDNLPEPLAEEYQQMARDFNEKAKEAFKRRRRKNRRLTMKTWRSMVAPGLYRAMNRDEINAKIPYDRKAVKFTVWFSLVGKALSAAWKAESEVVKQRYTELAKKIRYGALNGLFKYDPSICRLKKGVLVPHVRDFVLANSKFLEEMKLPVEKEKVIPRFRRCSPSSPWRKIPKYRYALEHPEEVKALSEKLWNEKNATCKSTGMGVPRKLGVGYWQRAAKKLFACLPKEEQVKYCNKHGLTLQT
eukprot:CAMPEP_0201480684 /NCGR_PEP_ID=MMETSP0151_2-20130828/5122_1 /ASSEMBLY_ACC=CAM_ASM_000257 /TAXON_ID=200890 /ORGANISM="Paramoeba atlantica, Strain 621/1 / CCAP 1560/9" /LENGTH=290 /DNA_ID=CAMNT_0047862621 /DNA_START=234 /DNA_END=1106 /DNA_ORIENTATION=-